MTDVVYFLTEEGTAPGFQELRYSLRSLEKHVAGVGKVFVVGAAADWWQNVVHLPEADPFEHNRDANIIFKMHRACREPGISDPFLFVNDDHYFSRDVEPSPRSFPFYHKGKIRPLGGRDYARRLENTRRLLEVRGLPTWNFDVHAPILIYKRLFLRAFANVDWVDRGGPGVVLKSVYGNSVESIVEERVFLEDLKFLVNTPGTAAGWLPELAERPCWSSGAHPPRLVREIWAALYPEASKYEREKP